MKDRHILACPMNYHTVFVALPIGQFVDNCLTATCMQRHGTTEYIQ